MIEITLMDKAKHFLLCFFVTLIFGWEHGVNTGLVIELVQAERGHASIPVMWQRLTSDDTVLDLIADALGIGVGLIVRTTIWKFI